MTDRFPRLMTQAEYERTSKTYRRDVHRAMTFGAIAGALFASILGIVVLAVHQ